MKRSKKDARTENLLENVARMCELLLIADSTVHDLAVDLCVTTSGVRNYLRHLRRADLVDVVGKTIFGNNRKCDRLRITKDRLAVAAMLKDLRDQPRTVDLNLLAKRELKKTLSSDKTRHVHKMRDDTLFMPKLAPEKPPGRHWLDLAFFGHGLAPSVASTA